MSAAETRRISKLSIKNFLGIEELELTDVGQIVYVHGPNDAGKSSIAKAIEAAFCAGGQKPELIRHGAKQAEILIELSGDAPLRVGRKISVGSGGRVDVTELREDGTEVLLKGGQGIIDNLFAGSLAFRPLEFYNATPDQQREMLLSAIDIRVTPEQLAEWGLPETDCNGHGLEVLAGLEKRLYDERKEANAIAKERKQRVDVLGADIPEDFDAEPWRVVDVSALQQEIGEATNATNRQQELYAEASKYEAEIDSINKHIVLLENQRDAADARRKQADAAASAIPEVDASVAKAKLSEYTDAMAMVKQIDALEDAEDALADATKAAASTDAQLTIARAKPDSLLAAAKLPFEGLAITADAITLDGTAIDHLADSRKLLLSLQIAQAVSGPLAIICVDGIEMLDAERRRELGEMVVADTDHQYVLIHVTDELQREIDGNLDALTEEHAEQTALPV